MSEPHDPTEALPTRRLSGDADGPTAHLGCDDVPAAGTQPTVHLASGEPTVHLASGEPTVHLASGEPTVHLASGEPTVHLASGEPTVHLPAGQEPAAGVTAAGPDGWRTAATAPGGGRTTAARPGTGATVHTGPAPAQHGGELRFGPGVPTTPPAAPAWPTPPTPPAPPRRRPVWRAVTSALSTLLTVALLAAVGLYLWQRISPLKITNVTVAVPEPAGDRCDVTLDVVATVLTNGAAGEIRYQWLRSGSAPGSLLTERVGRGQRTVELTLRWAFSGVGTTTETATINITSPSPVQAQTPVRYDCRRT
ncbi:hypothetical protein [Micromonospora deserti]|uniref:Uncharacterized protein n=1 Tax=Micromonospora deserti TaxID=2070366 RepID=A0A2W2CKN0_9ACTN|nr:hypothetical protein [Micromonospora deserti]PZF99062.1 hypothetical protein C1I99_12255 [Micromonospora deserti]